MEDYTQLTNAISEFRTGYPDFVYDQARDFIAETAEAPAFGSDRLSARNRTCFLFAMGQGFVEGYAAAIDDDYDPQRTDIVPRAQGLPWWREATRLIRRRFPGSAGAPRHEHEMTHEERDQLEIAIALFGEVALPSSISVSSDEEAWGYVLRPFTLARTSAFLAGPNAEAEGMRLPRDRAGYGFAVGFEYGLDDVESGRADELLAAEDPEAYARRQSQSELAHVSACVATALAVSCDLPRICAALGILPEWEDSVRDSDAAFREAFGDGWDGDELLRGDWLAEQWDAGTNALGEVGQLMRELADATERFVLDRHVRRSGRNAITDDELCDLCRLYATQHLASLCDRSFGSLGRISEPEDMDMTVRTTCWGIAEECRLEEDIAHAVEAGVIGPAQSVLARGVAYRLMEGFAMQRQLIDDERTWEGIRAQALTGASRGNWAVLGIAYAHGVEHALELGLGVDEEMRARYARLVAGQGDD